MAFKRERPAVQYADTRKKARRFMNELFNEAYLNQLEVAVDTEHDPITLLPTLMSYSWGRGIRRVVHAEFLDEFKDWLEDENTRTVWQNLKADKESFDEVGINILPSYYADVMITGWLRDETLLKHGLKYQCLHYLNWRRKEYGMLFAYVPAGKKKPITMTPYQVMHDLPPDALQYAVVSGNMKQGFKTTPRTREEWIQLMLEYAGDDAESTGALHREHKKHLKKVGYWNEYLRVDKPFTLTLMECEDAGVLLDIPRLRVILRKQDIRIMRAEHAFRAAAGNPKLNLRSAPQMKELLINEWGWPVREDLRTPTGDAKMDKQALYWWSDEGYTMADVKLEFNNAATMKGTFLQGLIDGVSEDGRLRSDFNQIGARTGRISSRKDVVDVVEEYTLKNGTVKTRNKKKKVGANLQNIPSRKEKDPDGIRGAFVAPKAGQITAWGDVAEEDHELIVCDYSGFELCMAIHWASTLVKNSPMLKIMQKYGSPSACHAFTAINLYAGRVHKCDPTCYQIDKKTKVVVVDAAGQPVFKKVDLGGGRVWEHGIGKKVQLGKISMDDWKMVKALFPDEYSVSKNNNFNLLYGGSPQMMARLRGLDHRDEDVLDECRQQADAWNDLYKEIPIYQRHMVKHGYKHGWVPTIGGWQANVKSLLESEDEKVRSHGERVCMNTPCQGSAAWIVKVAMNICANDNRLRELRCKMLFPVHDELVFEVPKRNTKAAQPIVIHNMKEPYKDKMAFEIDVEGMFGGNWLEAKG